MGSSRPVTRSGRARPATGASSDCIATDAGRAVLAQADAAYLAKLDPLLDEIPKPECFIADLLAVGDAFDARLGADMGVPPQTSFHQATTEAAL